MNSVIDIIVLTTKKLVLLTLHVFKIGRKIVILIYLSAQLKKNRILYSKLFYF